MADKFIPYRYVKGVATAVVAPIQPSIDTTPGTISSPDGKKISTWARIVPSTLITLGSIMIANVVWPVISYQLFTAPQIQKEEFVSPIPVRELGNGPLVIPGMANVDDLPGNMYPVQVLGADTDYTDPKNWFPTAGYAPLDTPTTYTIDIPSLDIEQAEVEIGGESLDEHLIHYPDTALPGQLGSPVIFGHSILRQFYNPSLKNPDRYNSIFSKIMTLKNGERIFVDYDGIKYTYEVKDKVEVKPEDLFILEQKYNNRELKLITCVPEGTYLRRGVVIAQLINMTDEVNE